jgi:YD repeat-containing protein
MGDTSDGYVDIPWMASSASVSVQQNAPRHTTADLGSFANHNFVAGLDRGALTADVTDLQIDSWGPNAALSRTYSSTNTASSYFTAGWRFKFQESLTSINGSAPNANNSLLDYTDENGDVYAFKKSGTIWAAPNGFAASLTQNGSAWALVIYRGTILNFDSAGRLTSEVDRNGNPVTYNWNGSGLMDTITAANGQTITLSFSSGKLTGASYATSAGTRTVSYDSSAGTVTVLPNTSLAHTTQYVYTANRLTQVQALNYSAAGTSTEQFVYDASGALVEVKFPDCSSNGDAHAMIQYGTSGTRSATLKRWGTIRLANNDTGTPGTLTTQLYTWNPTGTMATMTNPKSSGAD